MCPELAIGLSIRIERAHFLTQIATRQLYGVPPTGTAAQTTRFFSPRRDRAAGARPPRAWRSGPTRQAAPRRLVAS